MNNVNDEIEDLTRIDVRRNFDEWEENDKSIRNEIDSITKTTEEKNASKMFDVCMELTNDKTPLSLLLLLLVDLPRLLLRRFSKSNAYSNVSDEMIERLLLDKKELNEIEWINSKKIDSKI